MSQGTVEKLFLINIYAWLLFGFAQAALINLILKITYSLDKFPCQLTFMSKPISIYIQCLYQHPNPFLQFISILAGFFADMPLHSPKIISMLTRRLSPQFISILDWFLCRLPCVIIHKKMKTYISEKQNYNSSAAQRLC